MKRSMDKRNHFIANNGAFLFIIDSIGSFIVVVNFGLEKNGQIGVSLVRYISRIRSDHLAKIP